jgi:thiol-disulfide isomerase/thioredoxin
VKRDPVIFVVVALAISLMLVFAYKVTGKQTTESNGPTGAGKPAPEFALQSLDGKTVHLSDFRGKAVVVNFWATWCQPCRVEMPWFVEMQKQYGPDGLQILGINADEDANADELGKFAKGMGVNYPVLLGKEEVEQAYGGISFLPVTVYVDRDGNVVDKVFGLKGRGEIEDDIKLALGKKKPAVQAQK